jgi:hypothetical protein
MATEFTPQFRRDSLHHPIVSAQRLDLFPLLRHAVPTEDHHASGGETHAVVQNLWNLLGFDRRPSIRAIGKPRLACDCKPADTHFGSPVCLAWKRSIHQTCRHDDLSTATRHQRSCPDFFQPHRRQSKRTLPAIAFWLGNRLRFQDKRGCLPATQDVRSAEPKRLGTNGLH